MVHLLELEIHDFRNYRHASLRPDTRLNLFIGENAQGKTNLMEAVYCLSSGGSYRSCRDNELIRWGREKASVRGWIEGQTGACKIDIVFSRKQSKKVRVNDTQVERIADLAAYFNVVTFSPDDLQLVKGSPSRRRAFLDSEISQVSPSYRANLAAYNKILQQRNNLLRRWRSTGRRGGEPLLCVYDEQLVDKGTRIVLSRQKAMRKLAILSRLTHRQITGGAENLELKYRPFWIEWEGRGDHLPNEDEMTPEQVQQRFRDCLVRAAAEEKERGLTLVGPQRDDILFTVDGMNLRRFGSQGQQRTAVLACKMAELEFIKSEVGEYPVILLDDVMSELDAARRQFFLEAITGRVQVFLTSTSSRDFSDDILARASLYTIRNGNITEQPPLQANSGSRG